MRVIIVLNSAMMRSILNEIFTDDHDDVLLLTANWRDALKTANEKKAELIIFGDNTIKVSDDYFFMELAKVESKPLVCFTGKFNEKEVSELTKRNYGKIIEYPDIDTINDDEYRKRMLRSMKAPLDSRILQTELKTKYQGVIGMNKTSQSDCIEHIVIGSSTGGPKALKIILDNLPSDFPVPISIVQHLEDGHEEGLAKYLNRESKLSVRVAINNDKPNPGEVILAVQGKHLVIKNRVFYYEDGEKVNFQKPAIDTLFKTASSTYKKNLVGILLTGMGQDGASGCVDILQNGGYTIVQDKETSTVFGMPKVAIESGGASIVLPIDKIAEYLVNLVKRRNNYGK